MLQRLRNAGLGWPTLLTALALVLLVSLGNWQMRRKAWKEELLARLSAGMTAPPVPLADALGAAGGDTATIEFRRVVVTGTFAHAREFHVWAGDGRGPAWSIVTPLRLARPAGGGADSTAWVLVIRGVVPAAHKEPVTRAQGQPPGQVSVAGRVRLGERNWAAAAPNLARNEWFARDLDAMRQRLAAAEGEGWASAQGPTASAVVAPVFVEAEAPAGGAGAPEPRLGALQISNRHLEYALTWYGLAATLIVVYVAFAWSRLSRGS